MEGSPTPLNWDFRKSVEEDIETPLDEEAIGAAEAKFLRLSRDADVYNSPAWARLDEMLAEEFQSASAVVFATSDFEELKLARERARVVSRLRRRPEEAERQLQETAAELRTLRGEDESPEE